METIHRTIRRQARVVVLGEKKKPIQRIWLALHGYGQLARYFSHKFTPILDGETLVVAPEGIHRFYLTGYSGRVGASWMTKEDRLSDINDNTLYLNDLWEWLKDEYPQARKGVLGFSQGAATMIRWVRQAQPHPERVVVWSGSFPEDLDWFTDIPALNERPPTFVLGDSDEFFDEQRIEGAIEWLKSKGLKFDVLRFSGGHDILPDPLQAIHLSL